jgi:hypothetical protein
MPGLSINATGNGADVVLKTACGGYVLPLATPTGQYSCWQVQSGSLPNSTQHSHAQGCAGNRATSRR